MKVYRAIIFDFNGIIVDDEDLHYQAIKELFTEFGLELNKSKYYLLYPGKLPSEIFNLMEKADVLAEKLRKNIID